MCQWWVLWLRKLEATVCFTPLSWQWVFSGRQKGTTHPRGVQGGLDPKCQKGLSGLTALASPPAALQMTLFVCLQRHPGRRRRS